jgi:hypothetical protein
MKKIILQFYPFFFVLLSVCSNVAQVSCGQDEFESIETKKKFLTKL